jgi:hypothetical protein
MVNQTAIAVGLAVGVPVLLAFAGTGYFVVKTRRRLAREEIDFEQDEEIGDVNTDLSYDNIHQLRVVKNTQHIAGGVNTDPSSGSSDDGRNDKQSMTLRSDSLPSSPKQETNNNNNNSNGSKKQKRFVPAYRKHLKSSMTNLANGNSSRNSSISNLNNNSNLIQGSNSSINSTNTNVTDYFYSVPIMDTPDTPSKTPTSAQLETSSNDLARSLQQPTPSYGKKPAFHRSSSDSTNGEDHDYNLKNNYDASNEYEIQEEDQYENEFTNYSESKRTFIESLRPKVKQ